MVDKLRVKSEKLKVRLHYWKHWTGGSMSVKYEVEKIIEEVGSDDINILAKSVGTMVAMHVLQKIPERIKKIILCGIPSTSDERLDLFNAALMDFPTENIVVFQNENDPLSSYEKVKKFMQRVNPKIELVKMPRSDHHYPYPEDFKSFFG